MSVLSKTRLAASALLTGLVLSAPVSASSWLILEDNITIPLPSLSAVNTDTFQYGTHASDLDLGVGSLIV